MATGCQNHRPWTTSEPRKTPGVVFVLKFESSTANVLPGAGQGTLEIKLIFEGGVLIRMRSPEKRSPYLFYSRHDPIHGRAFQFDPLLHFSSINASNESIAAIIQTRHILQEDQHEVLTSDIAEFAYKLVEGARTDGLLDIKLIVHINYTKTRLHGNEIESIIEQFRCFKAAVSLEGDRTLRGTCLHQLKVEEGKRISVEHFQQLTASKCDSYRTCAVCLDEIGTEWMQAAVLLCMHRFHMKCIRVWLQQSSSCPLCRSNFSTFRACLDA